MHSRLKSSGLNMPMKEAQVTCRNKKLTCRLLEKTKTTNDKLIRCISAVYNVPSAAVAETAMISTLSLQCSHASHTALLATITVVRVGYEKLADYYTRHSSVMLLLLLKSVEVDDDVALLLSSTVLGSMCTQVTVQSKLGGTGSAAVRTLWTCLWFCCGRMTRGSTFLGGSEPVTHEVC